MAVSWSLSFATCSRASDMPWPAPDREPLCLAFAPAWLDASLTSSSKMAGPSTGLLSCAMSFCRVSRLPLISRSRGASSFFSRFQNHCLDGVVWMRRAGVASAVRDEPAGKDLLALRALASRPLNQLTKLGPDIAQSWRNGDAAAVDRLAELELKGLGLRPAKAR